MVIWNRIEVSQKDKREEKKEERERERERERESERKRERYTVLRRISQHSRSACCPSRYQSAYYIPQRK